MKLRTLTVALAATAGLAFSANGAMAQQAAPAKTDYHTNPTPEEMSQTKALNDKQAEIRGVSASGQTGQAIDASAQETQQQYEEKLRANQELQDRYQQQMEEYKKKYGDPNAKYNAPAKS